MGARPSSFAGQKKTEPKSVRVWSPQQAAIFDWFSAGKALVANAIQFSGDIPRNLVVRARAGTGKTTTIIEGIKRAPETRILLCAFNKRIAEELNSRLADSPAVVKTLHALGYQMIRDAWGSLPVAEAFNRANFLTQQAVDKGTPVPMQRLVNQLHTKGREMCPLNPTYDELLALAFRFDLIPDEGWTTYSVEWVVERALDAMRYAREHAPKEIDYADMIYLPLAWSLTSKAYDLVVVDEAQDMTIAQLEIGRRVCAGRMCIVGDDKQAIYGFRGADSKSLDRLKGELNAAELPLSITYRCGAEIVKYAQRLVPDIQPLDGIHPGQITSCGEDQLVQDALPGDFVLSRLNAPLVSMTLRLLGSQKRAKMAGRDLGSGIQKLITKLNCYPTSPVDKLLDNLSAWERKQCARLAAYGQGDQIARIHDQADTVRALADGCGLVRELLDRCATLFTDDESGSFILCSSVHKAKGLEANRVFVLMDTLYRRGRNPEECNIEYVAITRAKHHLILVS